MRAGRPKVGVYTRAARLLCAIALFVFLVPAARGDIISLIAYVSSALLDVDGNPLAQDCIVFIFGSADDVNDGPVPYGGDSTLDPGECFLPSSVQGDDVYLGMVRIGRPYWYDEDDNPVPGTFYSDMQIKWDNEEVEVNYLYIRFFNATVLTGMVVWGTSGIFAVNANFLVVTQDFIGGYTANMTNCVPLIPEPSTAQLFLLFGGLLAGLSAGVKRKNRQASAARRRGEAYTS